MRYLFVFVLITISSICSISQPNMTYFDNTIKDLDVNNVPNDYRQFYFPIALFPHCDWVYVDDTVKNSTDKTYSIFVKEFRLNNQCDTFVVRWYSSHLFAMREPLLFNRKIDKQVYRFTWLRTFDEPIVIRIEKHHNNYSLFWKENDGKGGYYSGGMTDSKSIEINKEMWDKFISLIEQANFWEMEPGRGYSGTDGSEWILEGADSARYHVVTKWSPNGGVYYNCCNYLIELAGLKINKNAKY